MKSKLIEEFILTTTEASELARKYPMMQNTTKIKIINWCKKYKIGKKIAGRWQIHRNKLEQLLKGETQ